MNTTENLATLPTVKAASENRYEALKNQLSAIGNSSFVILASRILRNKDVVVRATETTPQNKSTGVILSEVEDRPLMLTEPVFDSREAARGFLEGIVSAVKEIINMEEFKKEFGEDILTQLAQPTEERTSLYSL